MNDSERIEYFRKVGACETCGSTPCSCETDVCITGNPAVNGNCGQRDCPACGGSTLTDLFGPVIYAYTRADAIRDGELIDLAAFSFRPNLTILEEAGIKIPTAITRAAYDRAIQEEGRELPPCQDLSGRMWDVCYMFALAARGSDKSEIRFKVVVWNWIGNTQRTKHETVTLKAICGPGDTAEPVITIMLPEES